MATIKMDDEQSLNLYMQDFHTKFISLNEEVTNQEINDLYKESLKKLTDIWSKKYRDGELMIEKVQELRNEIRLQNRQIEAKQEQLLEEIAKIKPNESMNAELAQHLHELKEELNKKKELAVINKKANKDRLTELQKSAALFTNRLGLEIRRLRGDKLQFVFRCINPKDLDQPYSCIISLTEEGEYEVTGFDPPVEGGTEFEKKVRETKNFSALLTNLRKAFAALCSQGK